MCIPNTSWQVLCFSLVSHAIFYTGRLSLKIHFPSAILIYLYLSGLVFSEQFSKILHPFFSLTAVTWLFSLCVKAPLHDLDYLLLLWERKGSFSPSPVD